MSATIEAGAGNGVANYSIHRILKGDVPYPLNLLESFARREYSDENILFYRDVEEYKDKPELPKRDEICDTYVKPGSNREINIASDTREEVLERQKLENQVKNDIFNTAQRDVFELVRRDTLPRFERELKENNLNERTAWEATGLGLKLLAVALVLTAVTFALQITCDPQINSSVPEFCSSIEILGNRFWRLLAGPFYMGAIMFILAGRQKFCPICATSGASFMFEKPKPSYLKIITRKVLPDYVIRVPEILAANRKKAIRSAIITMMLTIMISVSMILLPPDNPPFYS